LKIKNLKIALVHDYLKEFGGAERVLEVLSDIYPQADIFTSVYCPSFLGPHLSRLNKKWQGRIHTSFLQLIPFKAKLISIFRFLSPLAFKSLNFKGYDLIITSATGAYFPNALNKQKAKLVCYCHTPPRYLYGLATARDLSQRPLLNFFAQISFHFLRLLDFKYAQNVDQFLANSHTTKLRIQKFYRKDALVINPPIDIPKSLEFRNSNLGFTKNKYFLTGGRLARAKRYDLAIKACNKLNLPLKIFGRDFAGHEAELKSLSGPTVEFLGEVSQDQKSALMSTAKAFIFSSDNEDFGMIPVEAMAHGCPVIAHQSGGTAETIINGKTGVFFDKLTTDSCIKAIQTFQKLKIKPPDCIARARQFGKPIFIKKIKSILSATI